MAVHLHHYGDSPQHPMCTTRWRQRETAGQGEELGKATTCAISSLHGNASWHPRRTGERKRTGRELDDRPQHVVIIGERCR